jgi:hypothetical protein
MSRHGSNIAHTIADIISKQIWSMLGHILRVKVRAHERGRTLPPSLPPSMHLHLAR